MISINNIMWGFVALGLFANLLVIKKNYKGFTIWVVTNSAWMIYNIINGLWAQATLFFIYNVFAIYGIYEWKYKKVN